MAQTNETILANVYLQATNDFQQRIPDPTQAGIAAFTEALFSPYNTDLYNQFVGLMNMISFTYVYGRRFDNPLAEFKKERVSGGGKTIREIAPKWFKAHSFKADAETLLKLEKPEFLQWFYTVNRQDQYCFSWVREELQFAMLEGANGYGLNRLMAATMDALVSSDNYDEMQCMLAMFSEADQRWMEPLYKYHLDEVPTDKDTANKFLQAVRGLVYQLEVQPSELYNSVDLPVYAKPEELILLCTPSVRAALDVNSYAAAFNLDYATAKARIVTVPENAFGISGVFAVLTTVDWFECRDSYYAIEAAPYNPEQMSTKYYLQHWEIISANPMVPCICFTTEVNTNKVTVTESVTGLTLVAEPSTIEAGDTAQLTATLLGTIDPDTYKTISVRPDACTFKLACDSSTLNSRTYVDKYGVLHTQKSLNSGDVITISATSTYGDTYTADTIVTIA